MDPSASSMKYLLEIERNRIKFYWARKIWKLASTRDGDFSVLHRHTCTAHDLELKHMLMFGKYAFLSIYASIKIEGESESNFPQSCFKDLCLHHARAWSHQKEFIVSRVDFPACCVI